MNKILLLTTMLSTVFFSHLSIASKPVCSTSSGGYCYYSGLVDRIYVNAGNMILIYFDTTADEGYADSVISGVTQTAAAAISITENPEFAKLFYSTALAAQASGRPITMQMRGELWGYTKIDRIWLDD